MGKTRIDRTVAHTMDVLLLKTMTFGQRFNGTAQRAYKYFASLKSSKDKKDKNIKLGRCCRDRCHCPHTPTRTHST